MKNRVSSLPTDSKRPSAHKSLFCIELSGDASTLNSWDVTRNRKSATASGSLVVPSLPGHTLFMVTPGGSSGVTFQDAIEDLISYSSWLVAALSVTPEGREHVHYLALVPSKNENWLCRHPSRWQHGRRLPQVRYSRGFEDSSVLTFSKVFNLSGVLDYLSGPKNSASFVTLLDVSPRRCAHVPGCLNNYNNLLDHLEDVEGLKETQSGRVASLIEKIKKLLAPCTLLEVPERREAGRGDVGAVWPVTTAATMRRRRLKASLTHGNSDGSLSRPVYLLTRRPPAASIPRSGYS